MKNNNISVYTIGHSNLPIEYFISLIENYNINKIIDIRSVPYSKYYPQYNKERLMAALVQKNIEYVFDGERLGGRIKDEECYFNNQLPLRKNNIAELVNFEVLKTKEWFCTGISNIILSAQNQNVTVLCSEENPARCHRNLLIARRLLELEVSVYHIRKDGLELANFNEQIVQISLF